MNAFYAVLKVDYFPPELTLWKTLNMLLIVRYLLTHC
jgi:hypothetical protein